MIDISKAEELIPLAEVAKRFMGHKGRPYTIQGIHRWAKIGVRGIRLEVAPVGCKLYTTEEALRQFSEAIAKKRGLEPAPEQPNRSRAQAARDDARARRALLTAGIIGKEDA